MSKNNRKTDFSRFMDTDLNEEAFASSFKRGKRMDLGRAAEDLYNAVDEDNAEVCEDDVPVSRKRSDGALGEASENDECFLENDADVCKDDALTSRKCSDSASGYAWKNDECSHEDGNGSAKTTTSPVSSIEKSRFTKYHNLFYATNNLGKAKTSSNPAEQEEPEKDITQKTSSIFPLPKAKVKEKDLSLDEMENAILQKVPLIRHDGGIYYYNGKTYIAIKNDIDLMELIRRMNVSASCFQTRNVRIFADLFTYFKSDPKLVPCDYEERLNKCRNYVVLNNCVLNVKKLESKSFDKKYLTFHSVDASWVKNPNPRRFLKFLNDAAMGDQSIVRLTLEVMGYLMSGLNLCKKFFVLGTARDSGKSTLALLLKSLINEDFVVAIPPNNLGDRFVLGSTRGKILNLAMDIPNGKLNATAVSRLKNITGSDAITIEEKYMRQESTVSTLRFLFGTNYPITLPREDDDDAFWERMVILPFMRSTPPSEIDRDLLNKLLDEKDDIVSLCLQHLHNVIRNNYTFSSCPRGEAMKQSWRRAEFSTSSMVSFWSNCIDETADLRDTVYASELHTAYIKYCADYDLDTVTYLQMIDWISRNTDPERCIKKRIHRTGSNPLSGYAGIKIKI